MVAKMNWLWDEEFEYIGSDGDPITVAWNMDGDDIEITAIYWEDKKRKSHYSHDELWEMDSDLAEEIMEYIDNEFLSSEDFWLTKMGYDF